MRHVVIVGGGITGLSAAFFTERAAAARGVSVRVTLLEAGDRLGGKVQTRHRDGFVLEAGPDAFVAHKPAALALVTALGLKSRLLGSNDASRGIAFVRLGRPVALPRGMEMLAPAATRTLLTSPLLSWRGKLRLLGERFVPRRTNEEDESVGAFVRRRCGTEVLERIAEPLLSSLHVGDVDRMSLHAACPRLAELEQRFGSLTRAAQGRSQARSLAHAQQVPEQAGFFTLDDGMATLVEALAARLAPEARKTRCPVQSVSQRAGGGFRVATTDGDLEADAVVLALPAPATARVLRQSMPVAAAGLGALRTASVAVVSLGFAQADVKVDHGSGIGGFGFFAPRSEGLSLLGGTWSSIKFDHRAPPGRFLARLFVGGAHGEHWLEADDASLIARAQRDLQVISQIRARPALAHVDRWHAGYPQYDLGHGDRIQRIEASCPAGLVLAGSAFHGVGVPDCIASGERAAGAAIQHLEQHAEACSEAIHEAVSEPILG
jgi:oxygen-dependent protoporphyrinogen oxidase